MAYTIKEKREFKRLDEYKHSKTRWMSQSEYERHKELFMKIY